MRPPIPALKAKQKAEREALRTRHEKELEKLRKALKENRTQRAITEIKYPKKGGRSASQRTHTWLEPDVSIRKRERSQKAKDLVKGRNLIRGK